MYLQTGVLQSYHRFSRRVPLVGTPPVGLGHLAITGAIHPLRTRLITQIIKRQAGASGDKREQRLHLPVVVFFGEERLRDEQHLEITAPQPGPANDSIGAGQLKDGRMGIAPRSEDAIDSKEFRFLPRDAVNCAETEHDQASFSHCEMLARSEVHDAKQETAIEQHKHHEDRNGDEDKR
jgi:hypothetical protein